MATTVEIASEKETLKGDLFGTLPAKRAAILVHGQSWDALGWRDVAPAFVKAGIPVLALNLRGYDGSTGKTRSYVKGKPWSPIIDTLAAIQHLRASGATEVALVGASMGGSAVLGAAMQADVECVVALSAPVRPVPEEMAAAVRGRKLFICAIGDTMRAAPSVLECFKAAKAPKQLLYFGGREHSRAMFKAAYGPEVLEAMIGFVARGL